MLRCFFICLSVLGILSCTQDTDEDAKDDPYQADSLLMAEPEDALPEGPNNPLPTSLIGFWEAVEIRVGDFIMTQKDMEQHGYDAPQRIIMDDYTMRFGISEQSPTIPFKYQDRTIISKDQGYEHLEKLTADTLIISHTVDGEDSRYVYVKQED